MPEEDKSQSGMSPDGCVWGEHSGEAYVYDTQNVDNPELRSAVDEVIAARVQQSRGRPNRSSLNRSTNFFPTTEEVWIPGESAQGKDEVEDDQEEKQTHFGVIPDTKKEKILKRVSIVVLVCVPLAIISYILYQTVPFPGR